ncbi:fasciclin-1-like isoform X2 [Condylostylus longicornis]|uniref:fasciclin-1-like isoform X2 n=1 Tax=Condylostylus longicornis TaxID=2530218 RepID=UPI00244E4C80|nr:fasciclin-1-like isoform X2 [Condylostylus longicornis]
MNSINPKLMLLIAFLINLIYNKVNASNIWDKLREETDLGQFYSLLEKYEVANATVTFRRVTLFIPTNEAFSKYEGELSENLVLYHIATSAIASDQLKSMAISSDVDGNLPLYIKQTRQGETFVNNARVVPSRTLEFKNHLDKKQVIYVIDQVLEPLTQNGPQNIHVPVNPSAFQLLNFYESFNIGNFKLRSYRNQVQLMKKQDLYNAPGEHTFFLPIDLGFKTTARSALVDHKVIDGHVILNNPLFTAAAPLDQPQTTAAFEDNIKVSVTFFETGNKMYVKSNTITADPKHPRGVVLAEIVKANIPVQNGVVHLISRPLMIIDSTVTQFLQDEENGALHKFYETIMDIGGEVLGEIASLPNVTILAPSNEAWDNANINNVIRNREKMKDILNMHVIRDRVDIATIKARNENRITLLPTLNNRTALYFNILGDTITVEGKGVNATLIQTDIAQTNGYVHIIDKVLGVPYTTVLGKLKEDPMLNGTYTIGTFSDFNKQLGDTTKRYTYFVTRDKGWEYLRNEQPSKYKKIFMPEFRYHSTQLLERHLVISDRIYKMKDLAEITKREGPTVLPTQRDSLKLGIYEELGRYYIKWNLKKIGVFRADVECTNGIIHVLDHPIMDNGDLIVTGSFTGFATRTTYSAYQIFASFLMIIVAKLLL